MANFDAACSVKVIGVIRVREAITEHHAKCVAATDARVQITRILQESPEDADWQVDDVQIERVEELE